MEKRYNKNIAKMIIAVLILLALAASMIAANAIASEEYSGEAEEYCPYIVEETIEENSPENVNVSERSDMNKADPENMADCSDEIIYSDEQEYQDGETTSNRQEEDGAEDPVYSQEDNDEPINNMEETELYTEDHEEAEPSADVSEDFSEMITENNMETVDEKSDTSDEETVNVRSVYEAEGVEYSVPVGVNLASMRLIVGTSDRSIFADESVIISEYNDIYILQFEDLETTALAYSYYSMCADFVEADAGISIAEGEAAETVITEKVMTVDENPLTELEIAVGETEDSNGFVFDIALIDTGANGADYSVSMLGDDARDNNGHGTRMLEYIREQDPDAKVLSIKALGDDGTGDISAVYAAMEYAISRNVRIINLSISALGSDDSHIIEEMVTKAGAGRIMVVGAAGNNGKDAGFYVPGGIEFATIIGAADENGKRRTGSNYGATVDYNVVAETTSEAAARFSGFVSENGPDAVYEHINDGFIFLSEYDLNRDLNDDEGTEEEQEYGIFQAAGILSYSNWYTGGSKATALPSIRDWLDGHPGGKLVDIVDYNKSQVLIGGMAPYIYMSNGRQLKYVDYISGADQRYSDVYWTISDPDSGYTYKMTLNRICSVDPYNIPGLKAGSRLALGVTRTGWFHCERFYSDAALSDVYSYFMLPQAVNEVINAGTVKPMVTYAFINTKVYRTDDPSAPLDLPYLFIGWTDIDAGQFFRNMSENFSDRELYKSDEEWIYTYNYGEGYDVYINKDMSSLYADGCFGINNTVVYQETDQHIYEGNGLDTVWGWTSNAGSNIRLITLAYPVTYKASEGGRITGISSEDVIHGRISSGSGAAPDEGYVFTGWKSDTDVKLSDGTVILKDKTLDDSQIADAVITTPVNFTAYFEPSAIDIKMPEAGKEGMGVMMAGGLSWMFICSMAFFAIRRFLDRG